MNILAIDQGTSATKALLVGPGGEVLGRGEVPVRTRSVDGGGVEADPEELFGSVVAAGEAALAEAGAPAHAVALANQGETVLAWDPATGTPLTPAIVWQDRRASVVCDRLADRAAELAEITGLPLDPYFAAPKMTWLRENLTGDGVVTTTDTWLLRRLGAGYVTDAATASRTMLLDLGAVEWSEAACAAFGIEAGSLPRVADCAGVVGETSAFGPVLPVAGIAVDQQAALLAQRCLAAGDAKCTYGTGAFLLVTSGSVAARSGAGLSASVAWRLGGEATYCLDGQVYTAGSALRWLAGLGVLGSPAELDAVGSTVPDSGGVIFVPALAGLGAPYWAPGARGLLSGLTLGTVAGAPGPRGRRGHRRVGGRAGRGGVRRPGAAARVAARGRRADRIPAAHAGAGRPAAVARAPVQVRGRGRDRARRGGAGAAGHRGGGFGGRGSRAG